MGYVDNHELTRVEELFVYAAIHVHWGKDKLEDRSLSGHGLSKVDGSDWENHGWGRWDGGRVTGVSHRFILERHCRLI